MESTARRMARARRVVPWILTAALAWIPASILAADSTPTPTPEPGTTANTSGFVPFSPDLPVDTSRVWIVLMILLTALVISAIFSYVMRKENQDTRAWASELLGRGYAISTGQVAAVLGGDAGVRVQDEDEAPDQPPTPKIAILGPTTIRRGEEAIYRAVEADKPETKIEVDWSIVDGSVTSSDVSLESAKGSFNTLSASKTGIFILHVAAGANDGVNIPITVVETVAEPRQSGLKAFFLGDGYGTINLALFLMAVIAALGAIGVVGDGTVSTIFGAMAGYIFGIAVVSTNKPGGSSSDSKG